MPKPTRTLIQAIALLLIAPCLWAQTPYEKRNSFQGQAFFEDINIWVYTEDFAKRFGMPQKWIDNGLKGAKALAFRVETSPFRHCGLRGDASACAPLRSCLLDVYLENSVKLPWNDERKHGRTNRDLVLSIERLQPSREEWARRPSFGAGLKNVAMTLYWAERRGYKGIGPTIFERDVYGDLNYFVMGMACTSPPRSGAEIVFDETAGPPHHARARELHHIAIPDSFTARLFEEWSVKHDQARTIELQRSIESLRQAPIRTIEVPASGSK